MERIQAHRLREDMLSLLTASLARLPEDVRHALAVLSCFGSSLDHALVKKLEQGTGLALSRPLATAVSQGFLLDKNGRYSFVHDRVQERVYMSMKHEEQRQNHFHYGLVLCNAVIQGKDDDLYLIAVGQLNLGGLEAATDTEQRLKVAELNLQAGEKTMVSDFSAYWYFDSGISFLPEGHWEKNYELSLALCNGAAECAISDGEKHARLETLAQQVMKHARCLEDKLNVLFVMMRLLMFKSKFLLAIEHGFNCLSLIGVITIDHSQIAASIVIQCVKETKAMLEGLSDEDLFNYKVINDPKQELAMRFLAKMCEAMILMRQSDQPVVIMRMVQLSLERGMNPLSPLGFALYGSFLAGMGHMREGYRYSKLSKVMLDKIGCPQIRGDVFVYATQVAAHFEPLQSVIECHAYGHKVALAAGNTRFAMLNSIFCCNLQFCSGVKLSQLKLCIEESLHMTKQQNHLGLRMMLLPLARMVSLLSSAETFSDSAIVPDGELENKLRRDNVSQSKAFYLNKMRIAFMFRLFSETKEFATKYSHFNVGTLMMLYHQSMNSFWEGLVSYWIGREEDSTEWLLKGHAATESIRKLVDCSEWNFQNKLFLLQAEQQFCARDFILAEKYYDAAISSSREHRFVNEEALSLELAAFFYLETGRRSRSIDLFSRAISKYREWEAHAKAHSLEAHLEKVKNNQHTICRNIA